MSSDEEKGEVYHEHQVRALVEVDDGDYVAELKTDWNARRDHAIDVAEELRDRGHKVQINSRPYRANTDFSEVPR